MAEQPQVPATQKKAGLVIIESRGEKIELTPAIVRNYLVTGRKELITDQEIYYFLAICKARHLNPFVKDCYLIKYTNEPAAIIVSIDFYRSRSKAMPDCTGWEKGVIVVKEDGDLRYSKGLVLPGETLVGGWFKATPKGWNQPLELEVNLSGYIKRTREGAITKFWSTENQPSQIMKVAESQGLRTVWPDEFAGTVTGEEAGIDLSAKAIILEPEPPEIDPAAVAAFDAEVGEYVDLKAVEDYVSEIATANKQTRDAVKAQAGTRDNFPVFWKSFLDHQDKKTRKPRSDKGQSRSKPPQDDPTPEVTPTTPDPPKGTSTTGTGPRGITSEQEDYIAKAPEDIVQAGCVALGIEVEIKELDYDSAADLVAWLKEQ